MTWTVGQKVTIKQYPNSNAILVSVGRNCFGLGRMLEVELDEPLPYYGRPNPRRKIMINEDWVTE